MLSYDDRSVLKPYPIRIQGMYAGQDDTYIYLYDNVHTFHEAKTAKYHWLKLGNAVMAVRKSDRVLVKCRYF